jgi:hypothetical protein
MRYVIGFFSKICLFPIALLIFLLVYPLFILSPEFKTFKFKMER